MIIEVLFPKIGFSMEEGKLLEWLVADGSSVQEGQPLYALESDKSVQEIESPASGTLRISAVAGEDYKVGETLATIDASEVLS